MVLIMRPGNTLQLQCLVGEVAMTQQGSLIAISPESSKFIF